MKYINAGGTLLIANWLVKSVDKTWYMCIEHYCASPTFPKSELMFLYSC